MLHYSTLIIKWLYLWMTKSVPYQANWSCNVCLSSGDVNSNILLLLNIMKKMHHYIGFDSEPFQPYSHWLYIVVFQI